MDQLIGAGPQSRAQNRFDALKRPAFRQRLIDQGIELARRRGCSVVGCGGFTSILTNNCRSIVASDVALTTGEFNLLCILLRHPGRVLDRDQLMDMSRGRAWEAFDRTIDAQVARLRKKIETDPEEPQFVVTVHGVGYKFVG